MSVSEWVALRQLYNAGEATAAEAMDALGMSKGAVSKIITRLLPIQPSTDPIYFADYRARCTTYYLPDGASHGLPLLAPQVDIPVAFDATAL